MDIKNILEQVKQGKLDIDEAESLLRENPADRSYEEMGFAKLDTDRKKRSGFAEVVYCQGSPTLSWDRFSRSSTTVMGKSSVPGPVPTSMSW